MTEIRIAHCYFACVFFVNQFNKNIRFILLNCTRQMLRITQIRNAVTSFFWAILITLNEYTILRRIQMHFILLLYRKNISIFFASQRFQNSREDVAIWKNECFHLSKISWHFNGKTLKAVSFALIVCSSLHGEWWKQVSVRNHNQMIAYIRKAQSGKSHLFVREKEFR